jgi:hypothetical protein
LIRRRSRRREVLKGKGVCDTPKPPWPGWLGSVIYRSYSSWPSCFRVFCPKQKQKPIFPAPRFIYDLEPTHVRFRHVSRFAPLWTFQQFLQIWIITSEMSRAWPDLWLPTSSPSAICMHWTHTRSFKIPKLKAFTTKMDNCREAKLFPCTSPGSWPKYWC